MSDIPVHIANERVKGLANVLYNLATALFATAAARVWADRGFGAISLLWLSGVPLLIWIASQLLSLLEEEVG